MTMTLIANDDGKNKLSFTYQANPDAAKAWVAEQYQSEPTTNNNTFTSSSGNSITTMGNLTTAGSNLTSQTISTNMYWDGYHYVYPSYTYPYPYYAQPDPRIPQQLAELNDKLDTLIKLLKKKL